MSGYDYQRYAVLYVDDEAQSLKYFRKAFEKDFRVLTAPGAAEAWALLEQEGDGIGVVVSDQRMPGTSGTDLLGRVRRARPGIVRVLTTAYSDLESAVEAVNSGGVFRYVTKPWDLRDLRGVLLRAMEFYTVQRERDLLMREKLSALQRVIVTDRVRSLAVLAAGLAHHIRNSMTALTTFLDLAPIQAPDSPSAADLAPQFRENLWALARAESERILKIVQQVAENTAEPSLSFDTTLPLAELVRPGVEAARLRSPGVTVALEIDGALPPLKVDAAMARQLFRLLIDRTAVLSGNAGTVTVRAADRVAVWGAPGLRITISGDGPDWPEERLATLFTAFAPDRDDPADLGVELLSAFFIAHHHGGDIVVHRTRTRDQGPGFEILLPLDPGEVERSPLEENCLEKLFTHFEGWDAPPA
ncbi:MAG: response regulator [Deferrisomatales bacterium]